MKLFRGILGSIRIREEGWGRWKRKDLRCANHEKIGNREGREGRRKGGNDRSDENKSRNRSRNHNNFRCFT